MASPDNQNDARRTKITSNSGIFEAASRFWQRSYAGDYLGLVMLVVAYFIIGLFGEPFHQMFRLNDYRLQHPHAEHERVPVFLLIALSAGIPAAVLCVWTLALKPDIHKAHVTALGLAVSIITTILLTDIFKDLIGRPRPDLIARCSPRANTPVDELVTIDVCTETKRHLLQDGWRSFPSGHSSFAFAGLGWLALFLASQTHCFRPKASLATHVVCALPLIAAAMIAISRLEDYRHDVEDVLVGSALGFVVAYLNWRRYYPGLRSEECHEPFAAPTNERAGALFQRIPDEEAGFTSHRDSFTGHDDERLATSRSGARYSRDNIVSPGSLRDPR